MGIVYILINPAMNNILKIGRTKRTLDDRLKELYNSSVPFPFQVYYAAEVYDEIKVESILHKLFHEDRVNNQREFFTTDPEKIKLAIQLANPKEIIPHKLKEKPKKPIRIIPQDRRKYNFDFFSLGIKVGEILHFVDDKSITCKVMSKNTVMFKNKEMSLSRATLETNKFQWKTIQGPKYWTYKNQKLTDIRLAKKL
jgi:hypothetical protein